MKNMKFINEPASTLSKGENICGFDIKKQKILNQIAQNPLACPDDGIDIVRQRNSRTLFGLPFFIENFFSCFINKFSNHIFLKKKKIRSVVSSRS